MLIAARGTSGTRRARRAAIVFGLGVGLMLSAAGSAGATGTLDQSQTTSDFIEFLVSPLSSFGVMFGQTFTDGITGNLDQVDLVLGQGFHCAADAPLHVAIETTSVGKPSNNVVASASLPSTGVPFTPDWTSVHFSPTAPVTAGTQYAIVLSSQADLCPDGAPPYEWGSNHGGFLSSYSGGQFTHTANAGVNWLLDPWEGTFKTFVEGPAQLLAQLSADVRNVGPSGSLAAKVKTAQNELSARNIGGACSTLSEIIDEVNAQTAKSIPSALAAQLIAETQRIQAVIGC